MESSGRRPIAFACRQTEVQEIQEDELHLLGLAYLKYPCLEEIKLLIESFRNADVSIKFVSEDELSELRAIACELGIFSSESDDLAREGEQIRDLSITKRMQKVDRVTLIETCLAKDKLQLVQSIQQNGHVVAFVERSSSSDTPTLKEVDVGITDATCVFRRVPINNTSIDLGELDYLHSRWPNDANGVTSSGANHHSSS
ncbi:hypothetical protein JRO89_XS01G0121300 [Xanthoceras sorbifolium]|uniref:Uncharacterized protein n=1 Tax=Xanthoceras sorbifolium TaxID=99658 RepID=A0ABQ8IIY3_9ROSI|nr:hypothetical protein JRO89_XS01G0121300 [Xanthoceras sorbifolium]